MNRKFTEDHEWLSVEGDVATVGITDYAQEQLGDLVFVELPEARPQRPQERSGGGGRVGQGRVRRLLAADRRSGRRQRRRRGRARARQQRCGKDAWLFKVRIASPAELDGLMDETAYRQHIA